MSNCRLLAIDLDKTLLDNDHRVSRRNRDALKKCQEMGIYVILASGREVETIDRHWHGPIYFLLYCSLANIVYWGYMGYSREYSDITVWKREWKKGILAAAATMLSYSLILHVMKTEHLSYIITLRESSVLMAVLLGWIVLKEERGAFRLVAAGILFVGLFIVAVSKS